MVRRKSYEQNIVQGLDAAYRKAAVDEVSAEVDTVRWIIFSDHHRGDRRSHDRFVGAERAYNAALGYYLEAGHTLLLLGDVEAGLIILIGATTENPFFAVNSPLVSRSQIFQFAPLTEAEI